MRYSSRHDIPNLTSYATLGGPVISRSCGDLSVPRDQEIMTLMLGLADDGPAQPAQ